MPATPVAARRFSLIVPVTSSTSGSLVTTGRMAAETRVAGKLVSHTQSFKGGKMRLSLLVPRSAKGKLLTVALKFARNGQTAKKTLTYRVR